jgi:isopentenyl-diphosphate delta-isomerase type 1
VIENLILVDEDDHQIGESEKISAHKEALRHRAFSIFIFKKNEQDCWQLLLQQRSQEKYHCGGLWTNTCCGHPRPGEETIKAAKRRLFEEMGVKMKLSYAGVFHYIAKFDTGLTENEVDHVFVGIYDNEKIEPNPDEVQDYRWVDLETVDKELSHDKLFYTPWFAEAFKHARRLLKETE